MAEITDDDDKQDEDPSGAESPNRPIDTPDENDRGFSPSDDHGPPMIQAKGLSKYYGAFAAVDDVSFEVHRGEVVAFLGPNGAGKSTTMKLLTGYLSPSAGRALVAGHDMNEDRLAGSTKLGYLPENGPLYPDMTPRGILDFFADARGLSRDYKLNRMEEVLDLCSLHDVIGKPIGKLSRGYKQRVGMALTLLHEPEVLILDEPTAGLDPNQISEVRALMRRLGESKTILISTHILQEVEAIATRVLFINEGLLVYDGPISEFTVDEMPLDERFHELTDFKSS